MNARTICTALALLLAASGPPGAAEQPLDQFRRGLEKYAQGDYEGALKDLDAIEASPQSAWYPEWLYDRAAALYKTGRIDEARELWVRAAGLRDAAFEAACRFNLGNCDYRQALDALKGGDTNRALEALRRARDNYLDAIRLNPDLADARANLELTRQLEKQLNETAPPSSQPSTQPNRSDRQNGGNEQQQSRDSQNQQGQPSQGNDAQKQRSDQQRSGQQKPPQNQPSSATQPSAEEEQDKPSPSEQPGQERGTTRPPPEQTPEDGKRSGRESQARQVPIRLTKEQAERLLQRIRDAEKRRRQALQAREAARYKPVDRDW